MLHPTSVVKTCVNKELLVYITIFFFTVAIINNIFFIASINKNKLQQLNKALDDIYEYRNNTGRGLHNCLF